MSAETERRDIPSSDTDRPVIRRRHVIAGGAGLLGIAGTGSWLWPKASEAQAAAGLFSAPTLIPVSTATKAPDANGFLQRWLVLEPISVDGRLTDNAVRATIESNRLPDGLEHVPEDAEIVRVGDGTLAWHAVETTLYNLNLFHFARALDRPTSNVLFWAVTVVESPRELDDVRLAIGSNAASIWWVNGEQVIEIFNDRQTVIDDGVSNRLRLRRGRNIIRAAIINAGGATDFCARLLDSANAPIRSVSIVRPAA